MAQGINDLESAQRSGLGLADAVVQDIAGKPVRLGDLWQDRSVVFVFVRHFG